MDKTILYQSHTIFYRDFMPGASHQSPIPGADAHIRQPASADTPVILLHGFAEDGGIWDRQTDHLKKNFRLLIPDLPGSGRSTPLSSATSMEKLADLLAALLDREKIDQAVLIGHSMGGYTALAFAEKYPMRCKAFGLFHSTAYADNEEKKAIRKKSMAFIGKHGTAEFICQSMPNLFAESSREQHPEWITEITERYSGMDPSSLVHYYQAMIDRPDRTGVLTRSGLPTLLVIGRHDNTLPFEASLRQSHMPSLAFIHILEEAGHMGMIESAALSNKILEEFLFLLRTQYPFS
jgi:pimeloyl-ACP methyl ester carboxylesterase